MLWQAKYPYLVKLKDYARRELDYYGPIEAILEDEESLKLAEKRLDYIVKGEDLPDMIGNDTWEEVLSFHAALMAVAKSGSLRLLRRFSNAEADRAARLLSNESKDGLLKLAKALGLRVFEKQITLEWLYSGRRGTIPRLLQYAIKLPDYLRIASQLSDSKWRLANSFPLNGLVFLDRILFEELLSARVRQYIEELADEYAGLEAPKLTRIGRETASRLDWGGSGVFDPSKFPPCIEEIVDSMKKGLVPTPDQLYVLVTFLANIGAPIDYLEDLLYSSGLATRVVSGIIARIFLEEARLYRPYTCKKAIEKKVCSSCTGKGPLSEYRRITRRH